MNPIRTTRLAKLAFGLNYFAQRQMSPMDMQQVDGLLDTQGIPRYAPPPAPAAPPQGPISTLVNTFRGAPPPQQPAQQAPLVERVRAFGSQHRNKLLIGGGIAGAAGLGAMFLRRRANEAQVIEPEMPNQAGF